MRMSDQIRFFATMNDLVSVLEIVESQRNIKYVKYGRQNNPLVKSFVTVKALPNLGTASNEAAINCDSFLISCREEAIIARNIEGSLYILDQLLNPDTITFTPGGLWRKDVLLHGRFATVSETTASVVLLKLIGLSLRKKFKRIKAFYVGGEAEQMLDAGKRLAIAVQSPRKLDLSRM